MEDDPRLVQEVMLPSGVVARIQLDVIARALAKEGNALIAVCPSDDAECQYVAGEMKLGVSAVRRGAAALHTDDSLTAWMYARLLCEIAVRMTWLFAGGPSAEAARSRLRRMEKRDVASLLSADKVLRSQGRPMIENRREIEESQTALDVPPAPDMVRMAKEGGWEWLYAIYRLASTYIHAGVIGNARLHEAYPSHETLALIHWTFGGAAVAAAGMVSALRPEIEIPSMKLSGAMLLSRGTLKSEESASPHEYS